MLTISHARRIEFPAVFTAVFTALVAAGCGAIDESLPGEPNQATDIGVVSQALVTKLSSQTDGSGLVTVNLYVCDWSAAEAHPSATCTVPSTDALVGGGAEVEGNAAPGGLLIASYPSSTRTWAVGSKDHVDSYPHRVRAYALGLQLSGVSGSQLRAQMTINSARGEAGALSEAYATDAPADSILVGGGARTTYTWAGHLLVDSEPYTSFIELKGWAAISKDHNASDQSGYVRAYAIWLPRCPAGFSGGCLQNVPRVNDKKNVSGYVTNSLNRDSNGAFAVTSVGGWASLGGAGAGRLLTDLYPTKKGGSVASKDHNTVDASGFTRIVLVGLQATE
jgi:hypothetical protein